MTVRVETYADSLLRLLHTLIATGHAWILGVLWITCLQPGYQETVFSTTTTDGIRTIVRCTAILLPLTSDTAAREECGGSHRVG